MGLFSRNNNERVTVYSYDLEEPDQSGGTYFASGDKKGGHSKGKRPSTEEKHQKGDRRRQIDQNRGEKGDARRKEDRSGKRRLVVTELDQVLRAVSRGFNAVRNGLDGIAGGAATAFSPELESRVGLMNLRIGDAGARVTGSREEGYGPTVGEQSLDQAIHRQRTEEELELLK